METGYLNAGDWHLAEWSGAVEEDGMCDQTSGKMADL
jgi:hypothetical protein